MLYTEEQLKALRDALTSGVLRVKYEGREITYRSLDEIRQVLAQAEAELADRQAREQEAAVQRLENQGEQIAQQLAQRGKRRLVERLLQFNEVNIVRSDPGDVADRLHL